jgi:AAA15 family ATPase/GTPase
MELINVKIENFRSLDELDFKFLPKCRVLVGINESGKSNILKALSMLDNDKTPTPSDIREANEDEIVEDAFVEFIFELNKEEIDENYENVKEQIAGLDKKEEIVKNSKDKKISLKILSEKYKKGVYHVDIIKGEKKSQYYTYNSHSLLPNWKKITDQCPADYICKTEAGEEIKLKEKKLINIDNFEEISTEYIEDAEFKDLQKILGSKVCNCIDENLPEVLFWEYDEKNVLPPKININQFKEDPNTCLPLKYMFHLHGIEDIKASIEGSQKTDKGFRNLLNRIAKQSTSHLHSVWKEYKKVQFESVLIYEQIPKTRDQKEVFLNSILTKTQTKTVLDAYPDFVENIMEGVELDLSLLSGIKEYRFALIKEKVIDSYVLTDLLLFLSPYGVTYKEVKEISSICESVSDVKEMILDNPYVLVKKTKLKFGLVDSVAINISDKFNAVVVFPTPPF